MSEHPVVACYRDSDSAAAVAPGALFARALDEPLVLASAYHREPVGLGARGLPAPGNSLRADHRRVRVLIVGSGIAALELLLALRVLAGARVEVTMLIVEAQFARRAMSVAEPFGRGGPHTSEWSQIARDQDAQLVLDALIASTPPSESSSRMAGGGCPTTSLRS